MSIGEEPAGTLYVNKIKTQRAIFDSDPFEIKIFKDAYYEQQIAVLGSGAILPALDL